jgi:hypothetical protein
MTEPAYTVVEINRLAQRLVEADEPAEITRLEKLLECSQDEAVTHFIENSCCGEDLPQYIGGKGLPKGRLTALRALWKRYESEAAYENASNASAAT